MLTNAIVRKQVAWTKSLDGRITGVTETYVETLGVDPTGKMPEEVHGGNGHFRQLDRATIARGATSAIMVFADRLWRVHQIIAHHGDRDCLAGWAEPAGPKAPSGTTIPRAAA